MNATEWVLQIEDVKNWQDLKTEPLFEQLDFKVAAAVSAILPTDLARKIELLETQMIKQTRKPLGGRQMLWIVYDSKKAHGSR